MTLRHLRTISNTCPSDVIFRAFLWTGSPLVCATLPVASRSAMAAAFVFTTSPEVRCCSRLRTARQLPSSSRKPHSPPFLFALRVPSETFQLRRAYSADDLLAFPPQPDKALIGTAVVGDESFMAAKFAWRNNIPNGCILRRPCFCEMGVSYSANLCPVRCFWPPVRRRVAPGQPLFRKVNVGNFNSMIKAIFVKLCVPEDARYSSHGFRRGTAQELKGKGSPWTAVATDGLWNSASFRGYVDMSHDVELGAARLFTVGPVSESDCELVHLGFILPPLASPLDRPARPLSLGYRGSLGRPRGF